MCWRSEAQALAIRPREGGGCPFAIRRLGFAHALLIDGSACWCVRGSLVAIGCSTAVAADWSAPDPIDPPIYAPSVSCASESFCGAVGWTSGYGSVAVYNDGSWSEATLIDPDGQLFSVSCPSSSFCMAMDGSGHAFVYDGSGWGSAATSPSTDLTSVSCVSASFCVAVGAGEDASIYNGSTWSALTRLAPKSTRCRAPLNRFAWPSAQQRRPGVRGHIQRDCLERTERGRR